MKELKKLETKRKKKTPLQQLSAWFSNEDVARAKEEKL